MIIINSNRSRVPSARYIYPIENISVLIRAATVGIIIIIRRKIIVDENTSGLPWWTRAFGEVGGRHPPSSATRGLLAPVRGVRRGGGRRTGLMLGMLNVVLSMMLRMVLGVLSGEAEGR